MQNFVKKFNLHQNTVCSITNLTQFYTILNGVDGDIFQVCPRRELTCPWSFSQYTGHGTDEQHMTKPVPERIKKHESGFCTTTTTWLEHSKVQTWWFSFTLDRVFRPCETGLNLNIKWKKPSLESCCKRTFRNIELCIDCFCLKIFSSYTIHKLPPPQKNTNDIWQVT